MMVGVWSKGGDYDPVQSNDYDGLHGSKPRGMSMVDVGLVSEPKTWPNFISSKSRTNPSPPDPIPLVLLETFKKVMLFGPKKEEESDAIR